MKMEDNPQPKADHTSGPKKQDSKVSENAYTPAEKEFADGEGTRLDSTIDEGKDPQADNSSK